MVKSRERYPARSGKKRASSFCQNIIKMKHISLFKFQSKENIVIFKHFLKTMPKYVKIFF